MNKLEDIKKILKDRLVDKIDLSDMEDNLLDSIQRKFVKELESWQQEAEKIITDSGITLQGDIKPSPIKAWYTEKIKLPHWEGKKRIEYPSTAYETTYIQYSIEMLNAIKTIQKELELCENKADRQRIIDFINLGKSLRMAEVAFYYPETIKEIISEKNQKIARKKLGIEGPVKQTIRRIIKENRSGKQKPSYKKVIQMMMDNELMADLYEAIKNPIPIQLLGVYKSKGDSIEIEDNDYDRNNYFKYRLRNGKECKVTFKRIESSLNELKS